MAKKDVYKRQAAILYDCADFSEYFAEFSDRRDIADRRNRVFHAWRGACNVPDGRTGQMCIRDRREKGRDPFRPCIFSVQQKRGGICAFGHLSESGSRTRCV